MRPTSSGGRCPARFDRGGRTTRHTDDHAILSQGKGPFPSCGAAAGGLLGLPGKLIGPQSETAVLKRGVGCFECFEVNRLPRKSRRQSWTFQLCVSVAKRERFPFSDVADRGWRPNRSVLLHGRAARRPASRQCPCGRLALWWRGAHGRGGSPPGWFGQWPARSCFCFHCVSSPKASVRCCTVGGSLSECRQLTMAANVARGIAPVSPPTAPRNASPRRPFQRVGSRSLF